MSSLRRRLPWAPPVRTGVETPEGLEPGGDVQREQRRPHPGAVHRHKARGEVAKGRSELRALQLLLDGRAHAKPRLDLDGLPVEAREDEAVGVAIAGFALLRECHLVRVDRPSTPGARIALQLVAAPPTLVARHSALPKASHEASSRTRRPLRPCPLRAARRSRRSPVTAARRRGCVWHRSRTGRRWPARRERRRSQRSPSRSGRSGAGARRGARRSHAR